MGFFSNKDKEINNKAKGAKVRQVDELSDEAVELIFAELKEIRNVLERNRVELERLRKVTTESENNLTKELVE